MRRRKKWSSKSSSKQQNSHSSRPTKTKLHSSAAPAWFISTPVLDAVNHTSVKQNPPCLTVPWSMHGRIQKVLSTDTSKAAVRGKKFWICSKSVAKRSTPKTSKSMQCSKIRRWSHVATTGWSWRSLKPLKPSNTIQNSTLVSDLAKNWLSSDVRRIWRHIVICRGNLCNLYYLITNCL